jgi:hypothetical protein
MNGSENPNVPFEVVEAKLTKDNDRNLWEAALSVLADEFLQRYNRESKDRTWIFWVGACSHWVRPNQARWAAAGGFAWPKGYINFSPELDWYVILAFQNHRWVPVKKLPGKRQTIFRVALPARSARHKQAAVHSRWILGAEPTQTARHQQAAAHATMDSRWTPGAETVFYGFRNVDGQWKCVAASDEKLRGHI